MSLSCTVFDVKEVTANSINPRNLVPDLGGLGTGISDSLISSDNLDVDWDALLGNPDFLDWI